MMHTKTWTVEVFLTEEDGMTHARAVLRTGAAPEIEATGRARRNPADPSVPEIGDEIAAARALSMLVHSLLAAAEGDIEAVTNETAHVEA